MMSTRTHQDTEPIEARIRGLYPELSTTERRLADAVLAQREALLGYTATELARLAQASKASAARFFRRLGYADFNEFRAQVRVEASSQVPLHRMAQPHAPKSIDARLAGHLQQDAVCLGRVAPVLDSQALARAVQLIARARRVWVLGYRNAHAVATYARALLHQVRAQVAGLSDASARETELLADVDPADVVLVIDLRRRTQRLHALLDAVHSIGARTVVLTDAQVSPFDARADAMLRCPTHFGQVFDSYVACVSLVNFLAAEVAARSDAAARKRLARIEKLHRALADLEEEPGSDIKTVT